jgi:hypothetical protein
MLSRVKGWLAEGKDVRIFTARIWPHTLIAPDMVFDSSVGLPTTTIWIEAAIAGKKIMEWCETHVGKKLPVTSQKDHSMIELWDDRAVQVEKNTGRRIDGAEDTQDADRNGFWRTFWPLIGALSFALLALTAICSASSRPTSANLAELAKKHIAAMIADKSLSEAIGQLAASGELCKKIKHQWRDGRPGEGWLEDGESGVVAVYADYHPNTAYRTCKICGVCQSASTSLEWR